MTYLNQVIHRTCPLTRCQCAVLAVLGERWTDVKTIWNRRPVYLESTAFNRVSPVAYGTITTILLSLVQQGYAERQVIGRRKVQYRTSGP